MNYYVITSLETHLFFARTMKEHALFLEAGFPCKEEEWSQRADWFRKEFESLLWEAVKLSNGRVSPSILESGELSTEFTIPAEKRTETLSGITIDSELTMAEQKLRAGCGRENNRDILQRVHRINEKSIHLLNGLIDFKEAVLCEVNAGKLFTSNYPLLLQHIIHEARLYRSSIEELMRNQRSLYQNLHKTEEFWNHIMMEHALFIRGLLDPSEEQLIGTADEYAKSYKKLLEMAEHTDCQGSENVTRKSLDKTQEYRKFKKEGVEGILDCRISSLILPLLADHVLREANHYIRILKSEIKD